MRYQSLYHWDEPAADFFLLLFPPAGLSAHTSAAVDTKTQTHHETKQPSQDLNTPPTQSIFFSAIFLSTHKPISGFWLQTLTIVFPDPLGPTSSTELLSPWTAVRFSSSRRCLKIQCFNYNTHNASLVVEQKNDIVKDNMCHLSFPFYLQKQPHLMSIKEWMYSCCVQVSWEMELFTLLNWNSTISQVKTQLRHRESSLFHRWQTYYSFTF